MLTFLNYAQQKVRQLPTFLHLFNVLPVPVVFHPQASLGSCRWHLSVSAARSDWKPIKFQGMEAEYISTLFALFLIVEKQQFLLGIQNTRSRDCTLFCTDLWFCIQLFQRPIVLFLVYCALTRPDWKRALNSFICILSCINKAYFYIL